MISLGQVPLLVLALTMLMIMQMSINSSILSESISSLENEATLEATTLGNLMIGEIRTKAYDNATRSNMIYNRSQLTPVSSLGPDPLDTIITNEIVPVSQTLFLSQQKYNDIDDYNGYVRTVQTQNLSDFTIQDSVCYVQEANPEVVSPTPTWYKMIIVTVSHQNMSTPLVLKSVVVYTRS
jgi:hypothetical protein